MYLDERRLLIDAEREAARSFDKTLIMLSSGALVLSIAFVKDMQFQFCGPWLLYHAWAAFIISLLSVVTSFLLSQLAMRRQRDIIEADLEKASFQSNPYVAWIIGLNSVSLALLALGIVFFAVFVGINMGRTNCNV